MQPKAKQFFLLAGVFCALFLGVSIWYAVTCQDARLVEPMDFSAYSFQAGDLPMLLSAALVGLYTLALAAAFFRSAFRRRRAAAAANRTRTVSPKLGWLGLLGFLGFGGFWTYRANGEVFPFLFFLFFGFFGFFYEGKLSDTFMDERFREEAALAERKACRVSNAVMFLGLVLLCQGRLLGNLEHTLIAVVIVFSLAFALQIFLREYLLCRYDREDPAEEE